jgi:CCR4-NOT transcriptional regulation complex NOT5 subunit
MKSKRNKKSDITMFIEYTVKILKKQGKQFDISEFNISWRNHKTVKRTLRNILESLIYYDIIDTINNFL